MKGLWKKTAAFLLAVAVAMFVPMQAIAGEASGAAEYTAENSQLIQPVNEPAETEAASGNSTDIERVNGEAEKTEETEDAAENPSGDKEKEAAIKSQKETGESAENPGETAEAGETTENPGETVEAGETAENSEGDKKAGEENGNEEGAYEAENVIMMPEAETTEGETDGTEVSEEGASDASSHMHASIMSNMDTYESGTTAIISVKYTLDQNSIHKDDYVVVTIPQDIASKVSFSLNSQHFSGSEDLGNGHYRLTFASDIESGLSGSFNAYVTTKTVDNTTLGTITVGDAGMTITVVPSGSPGGTGTYTDTIMKDAAENEGVNYGGYDYSEGTGDAASQIGIADLTDGGIFKYRLYINDKQGEISDVTVTDRLPDGMTFNSGKGIEVIDRNSGVSIDPSLYSTEIEGQILIFRFPGTFSNTIQVNYWVDIPAGSNTSKYTNTATITYSQNGSVHQEHRSYVLQGKDNNASNGEKSVDKSIISTDPDDQLVTYTIKFWNSNGFAAGEINLTDQLDSHVKFVNADPNEYFSVVQDNSDPQKITITNTKAIDGSMTTYVRFIVDMSDVPAGYTVRNTVGGNTTKTTKYGGSLVLTASKQINGGSDNIADGQFQFQLLSENGEVLQTKSNDKDGKITFASIAYKTSDAGKTFTYQVKEVAGTDDTYTYDPSIYTVTVVPELEKDADGNPTGMIIAKPDIRKGDEAADSIVFNNTINKTDNGNQNPTPDTNTDSGGGGTTGSGNTDTPAAPDETTVISEQSTSAQTGPTDTEDNTRTSLSRAVETGDDAHMILDLFLFFGSSAAFIASVLFIRKHRERADD